MSLFGIFFCVFAQIDFLYVYLHARIMKDKANTNLKAAQILIDSSQYTHSIHCSYYAVFQYMKYILAHAPNNPIDYTDQNKLNVDSHEHILNELANRIDKQQKEVRNFKEKVRFLKKERKNADYHLTDFTDIESLECKSQAEGLIMNLKTYFGNI